MVPLKAVISWSGGKDSMLALHELPATLRPHALVTTVDQTDGRIGVHGVRGELLQEQAEALGLPLQTVALPAQPSNAVYEDRLAAALLALRQQGAEVVVYGDIYLADICRYREQLSERYGFATEFPLWGRPSARLADRFLDLGYEAIITCVDTSRLDAEFVGRRYDRALLADLPKGIDRCGENGEFHTFVVNGPRFKRPIAVKTGGRFWREDRFVHCELYSQPTVATSDS